MHATFSVYWRLGPHPAPSLAVIVNVYGPVAVGVPERTPAEESERPGGSAPPPTANVTGATPPDCAIVALYDFPAVAFDSEAVVIDKQMTLSVRPREAAQPRVSV